MVEFKNDDTKLSRRTGQVAAKSDNRDSEDTSNCDHTMDNDKLTDDVFEKGNQEGGELPAEGNPGLISRLSGGVMNTASTAVGTAYGGVSWVAGGVWSTTGTAIGATYNTVSALSPMNLFRKQSKSKSD